MKVKIFLKLLVIVIVKLKRRVYLFFQKKNIRFRGTMISSDTFLFKYDLFCKIASIVDVTTYLNKISSIQCHNLLKTKKIVNNLKNQRLCINTICSKNNCTKYSVCSEAFIDIMLGNIHSFINSDIFLKKNKINIKIVEK